MCLLSWQIDVLGESVLPKATLLFVLAIVLLGCGETPPSVTLTDGPTADWPAYGGAPGGGHYSTANEITPANVPALQQAWTHNSGDFREGQIDPENLTSSVAPSAFQATPIVVDDTLYYCTPFNRVFALDAETGQERWSFDPEVDTDQALLTNCRGVSSWRGAGDGFCEHRIMAGTLDARIFAIDAKTGKPCPDFGNDGAINLREGLTDHELKEYAITSPPAILGDRIFTGAQVLDGQRSGVPAGVVRAYNVRSGDFLWGWNPVPPGMSPTDEEGRYRAGTTNVWSIISVDEVLNLVYVPTGNTAHDYWGGDRQGMDHYSSSIVALHADTGEVAWHFQTVHHDIWDYDVPSQPTLVDLEVGGVTVPALVQVTKMGLTFVLNRETGEPIWPVEERPVPQEGAVPGEYLSPTQPFPTHPVPVHQLGITPDDAWGITPLDRNACRKKLAAMRTGPIYTPPSLEGTANYPSQIGGNNWGSPALDPQRQLLVVNTSHIPYSLRPVPRAECDENVAFRQLGAPYCVIGELISSPIGAPCTAPPWGTLGVVDLNSGELKWQRGVDTLGDLIPVLGHLIEGGPTIGGPMVTATGLIFMGATSDFYLRAFDIDSGEELWKGRLPTTANSVPMSYRVRSDGRQFVAVAAGGHWSGLSPADAQLTAFALPE